MNERPETEEIPSLIQHRAPIIANELFHVGFIWIDPRKVRACLTHRRFAHAGFNTFVDRLLALVRHNLRKIQVRRAGGKLPKRRRSKSGGKRLL